MDYKNLTPEEQDIIDSAEYSAINALREARAVKRKLKQVFDAHCRDWRDYEGQKFVYIMNTIDDITPWLKDVVTQLYKEENPQ